MTGKLHSNMINAARVLRCADSREFLCKMGIQGKIISTPSHSKDRVSVILDSGDCFVGDLQRREYDPDTEDWKRVMRLNPKRINYVHGPMAESICQIVTQSLHPVRLSQAALTYGCCRSV